MMRQRSGRIINMSSVSGLMGNPGQSNYSASKAGIIGFTQTVARELASRKVTVNAICPGFIATEMAEALGPAIIDEVKKRIPAKRLGEADEIADAVLYLASDSAAYITGQVITIDGGMTRVESTDAHAEHLDSTASGSRTQPSDLDSPAANRYILTSFA